MHRSGTSATTRVVNLAGVPLAQHGDLWLGQRGNETGYWESSSLTRFNEKLLRVAGGSWWRPPDETSIASLAERQGLLDGAASLFNRLHAEPAWVWKDPRVCLLLPFWRRVLPESLRAVLVLRHPFEVATSLAARDSLPWAWSLALWETYIRRAVVGLEGLATYLLPFAALIADTERVVGELVDFAQAGGLAVSRPSSRALGEFLRADLRHSAYDEADLLASGNAALLELLKAVEEFVGPHEAFRPPALLPVSAATRDTLGALATLDPAISLPDALTSPQQPNPPTAEDTVTTDQYPEASELESQRTWRTWVATSLLTGVEGADLVAVLEQNGMSSDQATAEVATVRQDPCFLAGVRIAEQLRKLESVLDVRHDLEALAPDAGQIAHHPVVTREQFFARYYAANRPVLIEGLVDHWPALTRWNPDHLLRTVPDAEIEVMVDRAADPRYEINSNAHKSTMRMADYVTAVLAVGSSNDIYMVANNHFLDHPGVEPLWQDFWVPEIYLDPARARRSSFFWFGPGGTVTPLHHDVLNVLFVQVYGSKRITLISSLETHNVYNETAVYSSVDVLAPDLEAYPRFARAKRYDIIVGPGQTLFIPVGWWHCVEALETSISMSFTNFRFPNAYTWQHPSLRI
jgi:hypothetical protein